MSAIPDAVTITHHTADDVPALLDAITDSYVDSWGEVPGEDMGVKTAAFRDRATAALTARNYSLVTAQADGRVVGFIFGYSLRAERGWWDGLTPEPPAGFTDETGDARSVVVAEFEVRRAWQHQGVGRALMAAFLSRRTEERATLASQPTATDNHVMYEHWGWRRIGVVPGKPGAYYREYVRFVLPLPWTER